MCRKIEALLKEKIGLDVSSVGTASVKNAINRCLNGSGYDDLTQYYQALLASEVEFRRLVEAVVIPETWFYRDEVPFQVLANHVTSGWLMSKSDARMLNILSIPCSTGEEPYTIAMVLDKIGFPAERMKIDAVDISQQALDNAKQAIYRENSFRSEALSFRDVYFSKSAGGYRLKKEIRERVNFYQGNLLSGNASWGKAHYDVIFCRNLLIYFDSKDQLAAIRHLYDLLVPDGLLFVGHAEANSNVNSLFSSTRQRGSFSFVKKKGGYQSALDAGYSEKFSEFSKKHSLIKVAESWGAGARLVSGKDVSDRPFSEYIFRNEIEDAKSEQALLSDARRLADEGALDKAEKVCQKILQRTSSADAYNLLGIVYEASNRKKMAGSMFRKAIYLAPNHTEALVHLALHVERDGKRDEALSLRRRAERAEQR